MKIQMTLNGKKITEEIQPGMLLLDFVRAQFVHTTLFRVPHAGQ